MISFTVYGEAAPAGSKTRTQWGVRESSKRTKPWKDRVAQVAGEQMNGREFLEGPLVLTLEFFRPRPKAHYGARGLRPSAPDFPTVAPDTTKLVRAVEDALQGIVFRNDAQIVVQTARKHYGEPARCEVRVAAIGERAAA